MLFTELEFVFELVLKAYSEEITHAMKAPQTAADLECLLQCSFVSQLFNGIKSRRQRERYAKENFPFVEPEQQLVGQNAVYHYVPLPKLLNALCKAPDIVSHLTTPEFMASEPTVYKDFNDGLIYREHFKNIMREGSECTILLLLYTDEVEVANPLGPKRGMHKLLAVYCSLLNLHVKYRSQLQNIYLLLLVRYIYVKTYGLTAILQPLLDDLNKLYEHGLSFEYRGSKKCAQVLVFGICGDNLSLNRLGGFSCCFSRGRVCRFCMVFKNQLADKTSEDMCKLRTAQRHKMHLAAIAVNGTTNKRLYGVNDVSPLLTLPYFDVTRQLPPDIMHDILEGGAECVLRHVLRGLLSSGLLSRQDLSDLSAFEYGPNDLKNKPVPFNMTFITGSAGLTGTASNKWCLLRFITLILGGKIPESNEDWELLLQFREILDVVFSPEIPAESLAYLSVLVQAFLTEFVKRYGRDSVIPKLHFLVHYPRFLREVGPLKHMWSMRFEAKHQQFKKLAAASVQKRFCQQLLIKCIVQPLIIAIIDGEVSL
nr:uncharacterized protein LOC129385914 [Dermacentor andersoni]